MAPKCSKQIHSTTTPFASSPLSRRIVPWLAYVFERIWDKCSRLRNRWRGWFFQFLIAEARGPICIGPQSVIRGYRYIHCLGSFTAMRRNRIEAYDCHGTYCYMPVIIFGQNVSMEDDCHIAAVDRVELHDNVMLASKVYISDHSHGMTTLEHLLLSPKDRPVISRGPVIIETDVWIGEGVAILPGVRIGRGAVIGANSVVTRDIPPYCTAAGAPARVLKKISNAI
nr:acyltransferase [Chromobacterium sp. ASV5]